MRIETKPRQQVAILFILPGATGGCVVVAMFLRAALLMLATMLAPAHAATILLKDGRTLTGKVVEVSGVADDPVRPNATAGEVGVTPILLVDDGLRRIYVHKSQIREILEQTSDKPVRIDVWQNVAERGAPIAHVGRSTRVDPFDEYGRRIYELVGSGGPIPVVQGITRITPVYTRVQGLTVEPRSYVWDMRIATSSIPRETLTKILARAVPQDDPDARLQIVRLFLQSERYRDARMELERVMADFPALEDRTAEIRQLRQLGAKAILEELKLREQAGQHTLVQQLLNQFPAEEVAGETLQQVREMADRFERETANQERALAAMRELTEQVGDPIHRDLARHFVEEIAADLSFDTDGRLLSFRRLVDDSQLTAEQKIALAISGWLVGANQATDNFPVALSLVEVRDGVLAYLRADEAVRRTQILAELDDMEGATVPRVAELLKRMRPPLSVPDEANVGHGVAKLTAPGLPGESDVSYYVQLPPEYNPLRRYPTIVTLPSHGYPIARQLDFWAGQPREDAPRLGQAMRHGYITIAVDWLRPHQTRYGYSGREHHAVLGSLRHALRHFAIDSDRVFLTGHDIGGTAAWDIGLAHPDLWAGVIPILAESERYATRYWPNGEYVPWYFVQGEKDGKKMVENAADFDRYLRPKFDVTLVEFQGRGYEWLNDEIQNLFDWMNRRTRRPAPNEFECVTMRPWDNYFWWLEVENLPEKTQVDPTTWPPPRGARPAKVRGKTLETNKVSVAARAERTTVWLTPDMVDFDDQITVEVNGRRITGRQRLVDPDLAVLLEDARTRSDREHPYWAKLTSD